MSKLAAYSDKTGRWALIEADALVTLAKLPDACVDAVITDPPYGIDFHGEAWDGADIRRAARTEDLSAAEALERWTRAWATEAQRVLKPGGHLLAFGAPRTFHRLVAGTEDAGLEVRDQLLWMFAQGLPKSRRLPGGQGTALKPTYEPILLARRPFQGRTTDNVEAFGTGALNIQASRIGTAEYWPANVALSHSPDCPVGLLDGESTGPSRLFFCPKATAAEREAGCEQIPVSSVQIFTGKHHPARLVRNLHPTVKPLALMRWLIRLAVPEGGVVLDPFTGSGSTGAAAMLEGRRFLGIEREGEYVDIACARLAHWARHAEGKR
jgi:DNA modification methylase